MGDILDMSELVHTQEQKGSHGLADGTEPFSIRNVRYKQGQACTQTPIISAAGSGVFIFW